MDEQGWVQVEQLIGALRLTTKWEDVFMPEVIALLRENTEVGNAYQKN